MALIQCGECRKTVSSYFDVCPHCGAQRVATAGGGGASPGLARGRSLVLPVMLACVVAAWLSASTRTGSARGRSGAAIMAEKTADLQRYARFVAALKQEGVVKGLASCDSVDLCVSVTDVFAGLRREDQSRVAALLYARHRQGLLEASPGAAVRFYAAATGQEVARYGGGRLEWRSNPSDPAPPQ